MEIFSSPWFWWLIAAVALFLIELASGTSIAFSLSVGCIAAMLISFADVSFSWQLAIAIFVSALCFIFVFALPASKRKRKNAGGQPYASNMDAIIGRKALVVEEIKGDGTPGRVKIDGDIWQALNTDNGTAPKGSMVEVCSYDSIILNVKIISQ